MRAHRLHLPTGHPAAPLEETCNALLDGLRAEEAWGRLLAARGSLRGVLDGLAAVRGETSPIVDVEAQDLVDVLCGWGPLRHYRGSSLFAQDMVRMMDLWVAHAATREAKPALEGAWQEARGRCEADLMRTMEAFEHLSFAWFSKVRSGGRSRAAGWFEVQGVGSEAVELAAVAEGCSPEGVGVLQSALPMATLRRLVPEDLIWLDVAEEAGAMPLAVGHVLSRHGRDAVARSGWGTARVEQLPPDVGARFSGRAEQGFVAAGTLEQ